MENRAPNSTAWPRKGPQSEGVSRRARPDRAEALAERLAGELAAAWRAGERPLVEDYLARHPELAQRPEAAARLIYEEVCLRESLGQEASWQQVMDRFPQWRCELEMLLDCHELLGQEIAGPEFPRPGAVLGDYRLLAEIGRGMLGCVFLAIQHSLGDRPVVLKVTRRAGGEHLSMARLQHPNIMPLYAVHDFPAENLRALCMPYLGGATLGQIFEMMQGQPTGERTGEGLLRVLDQVRTDLVALPAWSSTRQFLAGATYTRAICWIGACLAEALHYAHDRGLLHLDLKPSNVLLADDGQPLLLDFHLAQGAIRPDGAEPERLGGTIGYMSPEQEAAMSALRDGRALSAPVDGRSDVYSLGVVLYEALVGAPPWEARLPLDDLPRTNPHVTTGLADILARALAVDLGTRYPNAAALANDLRRHLEHLPLQGVPNRSFVERWWKWWRRHPLIIV
jgi:serine/threonine protein kinase